MTFISSVPRLPATAKDGGTQPRGQALDRWFEGSFEDREVQGLPRLLRLRLLRLHHRRTPCTSVPTRHQGLDVFGGDLRDCQWPLPRHDPGP